MLLTSSMDERVADDLRRVRGVRAVAGGLVDLVVAESGRPMLVEGMGDGQLLVADAQPEVGAIAQPGGSRRRPPG